MFVVARVGAKARQEKLTPEQRREIARTRFVPAGRRPRKRRRLQIECVKLEELSLVSGDLRILTIFRLGAPNPAKNSERDLHDKT